MSYFSRVVIFLALGVAILHGLASIARTIDPEGTSHFLRVDQKNIEQVLENRETVQAIVLGNSHGDDIDFSSIGYEGYSLARAWGDLFEIQYYLKYLVPRLPGLKAVFIPVSYFLLDWDNAHVDKLVLRRTQMYTAVPSWTTIPWDYRNFVVGRGSQILPFQTVLREDNWQGIFNSLVFDEADPASAQASNDECKYPEEDQLSELSKTRAAEQVQFAEEIALARPSIREDTYQVLLEIIQYLREHNIRLVLFTPPYYEAYTEYYLQNSHDSIVHMKEVMARLKSDFGIVHYDFSQDERFAPDYKLFKDADHLNRCGKQMFSQNLHESLSENAGLP